MDYERTIAPFLLRKITKNKKRKFTMRKYDLTTTYILNLNTKKFHLESCSSVKNIKLKNKKEYVGNRDKLISDGYEPCKVCNP